MTDTARIENFLKSFAELKHMAEISEDEEARRQALLLIQKIESTLEALSDKERDTAQALY